MSNLKPLSKKHQRVLDEYLVCFVQWEAYQKVYPKASYDSARSLSSELFANPNFSSHLQARLDEAHMSANEALKLTADIARGDVSQFVTPFGGIDIDKIRQNGRLVKKIRTRTITKIGKGEKDEDTEINDVEIELYPADAALDRILRVHGKFTDRVDVTSGGESLKDKDTDDTRAEILRKLAGIAAATGADKVIKRPDTGTS